MGSSFIPGKDAEFTIWIATLAAYLGDMYKEFGISEEIYNALAAKIEDFHAKYMKSEAPETRTRIAIADKNEARAALEKEVRQINAEFIAHNRLVSDRDREIMGLPVRRDSRTPVQTPVTRPEFNVETPMPCRLVIHFRDHGSTSKAKPAGIHGAEVKWTISDTPPASVSALNNSSFDTRSPLTLDFADEQRGKRVYFRMRWENNRGEKGPWSDMASAIVP